MTTVNLGNMSHRTLSYTTIWDEISFAVKNGLIFVIFKENVLFDNKYLGFFLQVLDLLTIFAAINCNLCVNGIQKKLLFLLVRRL